jgi:hypothetical protein
MTLSQIYACIPKTSACPPGCSECCGPVPFTAEEAKAAEKFSGKKPHLTGIDCGYCTPQGCEIYPVRPLMCRLFGATDSPNLKCLKGIRAENALTEGQSVRLIQAYHELGDIVFPTEADLLEAVCPKQRTA